MSTVAALSIADSRLERIERLALTMRLTALHCVKSSGFGFLGSCFSCADALAAVVDTFRVAPQWQDQDSRDFLVLSKGHAAPLLYAALDRREPADVGASYARVGSRFQGHPNRRFNPSVDVTTGSVGNGLAIAVGLSAGLTIRSLPGRVVAVVGDGELQAGTFWEAYFQATRRAADRLLLIVDANGFQSNGPVVTNKVAAAMLKAGAPVIELSGHDLQAIIEALDGFCREPKFQIIFANTQRGHGLRCLEQRPHPMGWIPDSAAIDGMIKDLEAHFALQSARIRERRVASDE
jgi:transketolase